MWSGYLYCFYRYYVCVLSCVQPFATLGTEAHQAPLSMGFSWQEYRSGLPFPPPEDLPDSGIEPMCPAFQEDSFTAEPPGKAHGAFQIHISLRAYSSPSTESSSMLNNWQILSKSPGEGNGNPFQYSCLESPKDGGA